MPFGRYLGRAVSELDDEYLDWLLTRAENLPPDVQDAITREEQRRNGPQSQGIFRLPDPQPTPDPELCRSLLRLGMLQKLTLIHTRAEADAVSAAAEFMHKKLGL